MGFFFFFDISLSFFFWNFVEVMNKSHLLWGKTGDPQHLNIQWHTPNNDEKDLALTILHEFLQPSITRLEQLMAGADPSVPLNSHEWTNECCRHLAVVRNCVIGSMTMIIDDGEETKDLNDR